MEHRRLGESGLRVSALALGTMVFGEDGPRGTSPDVAKDMIEQFLDAGGTHFDTANVYAGGRSEAILGDALKGRRDDVTIATKVRFRTGEGPNDEGLSRRHVIASLDASLARLRTDYVDLLYVHCWDPWTPLGETLAVLDDLVREGKVRYVGVSNYRAWQVAKARTLQSERGWAPFVAAQYQWSLVERNLEAEFDTLCWDEGIGMMPWGPLGGGFLSGKYVRGDRPSVDTGRIGGTPDRAEESWAHRDLERNWEVMECVHAIAAVRGATMSQVALAWLLSRPTVSSVLLGARTPSQLADNFGAMQVSLSDGEVATLDAVSAPDRLYPYRMIDTYGART